MVCRGFRFEVKTCQGRETASYFQGLEETGRNKYEIYLVYSSLKSKSLHKIISNLVYSNTNYLVYSSFNTQFLVYSSCITKSFIYSSFNTTFLVYSSFNTQSLVYSCFNIKSLVYTSLITKFFCLFQP